MEFQYRIYPDERFIAFKCLGALSLDFTKESYLKLSEDPDFDPTYNTEVMLPEEARELAKFVIENQLATGRCAGLVDKPVLTALGAIYKAAVEPQHRLELFSTVEGASNFLGRDVSKYLI